MFKRLHYFNHQFLVEQDFLDEQKYHMSMRRHLNREFHSSGIVSGLHLKQEGQREITVSKGFAIDQEGRELIVPEPVRHELKSSEHRGEVYVTLTYEERFEAAGGESGSREYGGEQGFNRVAEATQVKLLRTSEEIGSGVLLGVIQLNSEGSIFRVHHAGRQFASSLLGPNAVQTQHLADGSVTEPKLSPDLLDALKPSQFNLPDDSVTLAKLGPDVRAAIGARGWVRLPFRPERLKPKALRWNPAGEGDFSLDLEFAHCDGRGARGSMAIPVPAGASRIHEFRIAGSTRKEVNIELLRTGWNTRERKGESTSLLKEELHNAVFDERFSASRELDDFHALTVSVHATGDSEIWLVAARFE